MTVTQSMPTALIQMEASFVFATLDLKEMEQTVQVSTSVQSLSKKLAYISIVVIH